MKSFSCHPPERRIPQQGQALIETILAALVILAVLLETVTLIQRQTQTAAGLAGDVRIRLLLEGELEHLRSAPGAALGSCRDEAFTPFLGVSPGLSGYRFQRQVERREAEGIAAVKFEARPAAGRRANVPIVVEGIVPLAKYNPPQPGGRTEEGR